MLWQLRCHCNPDHDKFSSTVVAIFPNVCLWRRSLCSNLALTLKNCIEPPLYASTAYVVAIWPSFLFNSSVKIWDTCENFFGQMVYRPPWQKISRTPMRLTTILVAGRARLRKVEVKKRFSDFFYNASSLNANSVHNIISKQRVKKNKDYAKAIKPSLWRERNVYSTYGRKLK